jgi:hypothetical protein
VSASSGSPSLRSGLGTVLDPGRWWAPAAWVACQLACPPLLLAFTPGLVLVPRRAAAGPWERVVEVAGASLSFWMAAFWLLRWLPVPLEAGFQGVSAASVLAHALARRPAPTASLRERARRLPVAGLLAAAVVVVLRLLPMNADPGPAGADMSMHAYLAEMILRADGIPTSYRPILPIDTFGTFPVGFHVHTALVALTAGLPIYRAALVVTCLTHAFLTFALFALVRPWTRPSVAALVAFAATFLCSAPQGYIGWGGNPTVLAIGLSALLFASLLRLPSWRDRDAAFAGLILSGVALTHTLVLVQSFYLMGVPLLALLAWRGPRDPRTLRSLAVFGATFLVVSGPYLVGIDPGALDDDTRAWIAHWVRKTDHVWHATTPTALVTIPDWAVHAIGDRMAVFVPLVALGLGSLRRRDPATFALQGAFFVMAFLLVLNARFWWLPLSPLIYPERVAAMLVLPLALTGAVGLEALLGRFGSGWRGPAVAAFAILALGIDPYENSYLHANSGSSVLRSADVRAFAWLDEHAAPDDVIVTQYGDAGLWVPAILFRPVTEAHVNVLHLAGLELPKEGRFLYLGARCVYGCRWSREAPPDAELWRLVHEDGASRVYERRGWTSGAEPGTPVPDDPSGRDRR